MQLGDLTEGLLESVTQMERFDMQSIVALGLRNVVHPEIILSFPRLSCSFCSLTTLLQNAATWLATQDPVYLRSIECSNEPRNAGRRL